MKSTATKEQFILLRAEGLSFAKISETLGISKSTCSKWEKDLSDRISAAKDERLEDLYHLYRIGKEAHIRTLGETINRINEAIERKDLSEVPADKLLKLKLEYEDRIQAHGTETPGSAKSFTNQTQEEVLGAVIDVYERLKAGTVSVQQAKTELTALDSIRKAIDSKEWVW